VALVSGLGEAAMNGVEETTFLDQIYATAVDAERWEGVMARFADMVGGSSGFLSAFDLVSGKGAVILSRGNPEVIKTYEQHYAAINPLNNVTDPRAFVRDWRLTIVTDEDKLPKEEFVRTEYYNDFVLPNESHSAMMIRLGCHGPVPQVLNINRSRKQGSFEAADLELAARYHPHFIRAFELGRALTDRPLDDELTLFSGSPHGLFVVDSVGRVARANPSAEALLNRSKGLCVVGGRLTSHEPGSRQRLLALIDGASTRNAEDRSGGVMTLRASEQEPPLSIMVAPLQGVTHAIFQSPRHVLVCVTDPARAIEVPAARLRELFNLTLAEARVALALVDSGDLPSAARTIGITANTARVHLARIFDKTGVNRQIALVNLIVRCAGPDVVQSLKTI
jgi:DNA-binding CsgD family transcriptional regulator